MLYAFDSSFMMFQYCRFIGVDLCCNIRNNEKEDRCNFNFAF